MRRWFLLRGNLGEVQIYIDALAGVLSPGNPEPDKCQDINE
jgi:hypothetical protein